MKIDNVEWKPFKLGDLFCSINKAKAHIKAEYDNKDFYFENSIRFISRTDNNNGCDCYIEKTDNLSGIEMGNAIVIGDTTASLSYQDKEFVCGDHMVVCRAEWINYFTAMFILTMLKQEKYKYSYGRAFKMDLIKETIVWLPINEKSNVDWAYIESWMKSLKYKPLSSKNITLMHGLKTTEWKDYMVENLFDVGGTKTTKVEELESYGNGEYPYVTTQAVDNGVANKYNYYTEMGGVLTIDSAVLGYCTYQEKPFSASDHVEKLTPKFKMNKYIALFFVTLFNNECYKYSYGRKANQLKIKNTILKLPTKNNEPDWQFMEDYIKSLAYADRI